MSPQAIEFHAIIILMLLLLCLFKVVTLFILFHMYYDLKALRKKVRLMGFKLADSRDIQEYEDKNVTE